MKYTVTNDSRYELIGTTSSPVEALKMGRAYQIQSGADFTIIDENDNEFDQYGELECFVESLMEYPSDELVPMTVEEAEVNLAEYRKCGIDIPEQMTAEILSYIWNTMLQDVEEEKAAGIQAMDDETAARFPDYLRFRKSYEDGSSAFFDPDQLSADLMRAGYDEVHREIIAKALMAYVKTCNQ